MDKSTAQLLNDVTTRFYRRFGNEFAQSRHKAWPGWERCMETVWDLPPARATVFDLGAGNFRFERFLEDTYHHTKFDFYAVDNTDSFLLSQETATASPLHFQQADVIGSAIEGNPLEFTAPPCDLTVAFGFFHHVPDQANREAILRSLIDQTRPGGFLLATFWQFAKEASMKVKVEQTTREFLDAASTDIEQALDKDDYLLGYGNIPGAYRYCHSFSDDEIDRLLGDITDKASCIAQFSADGRTHNLNRYLILQVN